MKSPPQALPSTKALLVRAKQRAVGLKSTWRTLYGFLWWDASWTARCDWGDIWPEWMEKCHTIYKDVFAKQKPQSWETGGLSCPDMPSNCRDPINCLPPSLPKPQTSSFSVLNMPWEGEISSAFISGLSVGSHCTRNCITKRPAVGWRSSKLPPTLQHLKFHQLHPLHALSDWTKIHGFLNPLPPVAPVTRCTF